MRWAAESAKISIRHLQAKKLENRMLAEREKPTVSKSGFGGGRRGKAQIRELRLSFYD
jgi:hypothetical protein